MKGKTKLITAAAVVVIAAFIGVRLFSGGEKAVDYETRPTVDLQKPQKGDIVLYTDMTGTIQPLSRASVMPKMAGEVLEVYFKAGDQVEAGQALVKIHSDALETLRLQMESAAVQAKMPTGSLQGSSLFMPEATPPSRAMSRPRTAPKARLLPMRRQRPSMSFSSPTLR